MNYIKRLALVLKGVLLASTLTFLALNANASSKSEHAELIQSFQNKLGFKIVSVADSSIPGLLQINTDSGIFYASEDGEYFVNGRIYRVGDEIIDETGAALKKYRLAGVERFKDSAIEYKAKKEKYVINVFTDTTCGYCRKLHNEMDILNNLGITVRYLAFPRQGLNSKVYQDTVSIWCSDNPQEAMDNAKAGGNVLSTSCENEVADQYNFGKATGVNSTPNIIMPDGSLVKGYQPAQSLLQAIKAVSQS
jgi:thiol:disulfide interchange protein DsbC